MTISDELLAAFLDGNTSPEDTMKVLCAAQEDQQLQDIIQIAGEVDDAMMFATAHRTLPMTAMAARKKENYLCDIECEEFVLHQLGIEATHKSLLDEAYRNCWLKDQGMPLYNIGRLLEKNHLSVSRRYDSTVNDIARLLESGNQLIAVINNALLTQEDPEASTQPNHAVAISSIDLEKGEITLFNPYTEEELTTYRIDSFQRAWEKSHCYLVVTNTTDKFVYEPYPIRLDEAPADIQDGFGANQLHTQIFLPFAQSHPFQIILQSTNLVSLRDNPRCCLWISRDRRVSRRWTITRIYHKT